MRETPASTVVGMTTECRTRESGSLVVCLVPYGNSPHIYVELATNGFYVSIITLKMDKQEAHVFGICLKVNVFIRRNLPVVTWIVKSPRLIISVRSLATCSRSILVCDTRSVDGLRGAWIEIQRMRLDSIGCVGVKVQLCEQRQHQGEAFKVFHIS